MEIIRIWAFWRRIQYITGVSIFFLIVGLIYYALNYTTVPTCFDGMQNGDERGVDCGGSCVRICASDVAQPTVRWVRSFEIVPGQYNAVAYVENTNRVAATPEMRYTITLYDEAGDVITSRSGTTILPPNSIYPIFESRINTGGRIPAQTFITLEEPELWQPAELGRDQFRVVTRELKNSDVNPRLEAKVENTALTEAKNVEFVATIFDVAGNALTSSATFVDIFSPRSQRDLVFTWPSPIAKTIRSCEVPSDVMMVLDRSGSMAADGGDPPEPLESAKRSAQQFVQMLGPNDQMGFLSYATTPSEPIEQTLSSNRAEVIASIARTRMGEDGIQYTNMGEAFRSALQELQSARKRDNARKVIIFLTDGDVTRPVNPETRERDIEYAALYAKDAAALAKQSGVLIYTIGFGDFFLQVDGVIERDVQLIKDLATAPSMYYEAPTVADLNRVYRQIASDICEEGAAVIDIVPKTETNFAPLR